MISTKGKLFFVLGEEMEIEPREGRTSYRSNLLGVKPESFIILDYTEDISAGPVYKEGEGVWVRFFRGSVFRFHSGVLKIASAPQPMLFLEYPNSIQEIQRRSSQRKKIFFKVNYIDRSIPTHPQTYHGYLLDISMTGGLVWGEWVHLMDKVVELSFTEPFGGEKISVNAKVVRCEVKEYGLLAGLEFMNVEDQTRKRLLRLISCISQMERDQGLVLKQ